jgi:hypothetical protein
MYWLTITRAADTNGPVVAEILALRHELAELLGYPDFVELHRDAGWSPSHRRSWTNSRRRTGHRPTGSTPSCSTSLGPTPATTPWS